MIWQRGDVLLCRLLDDRSRIATAAKLFRVTSLTVCDRPMPFAIVGSRRDRIAIR